MTENKTIDFFVPHCQRNKIVAEKFGLCDKEDKSVKTPAYVDFDHPEQWIAVVENQTHKPLNFTAVDNCVEILRENGEMANRCDVMLTNEDYIVFVELKDQKGNWIEHAVYDQLQTTIDYFKANHDISKYRYKRAFACNRQHPKFKCSNKERMQSFFKQNGIRLNIQCNIVFK